MQYGTTRAAAIFVAMAGTVRALALLMRAGTALIPNDPAHTLSAPQNSGGAHETQRCPQPAWGRGGVVAAEGACAAGGAGDRLLRCNLCRFSLIWA
jgi:hypothetical protein